MRVVLRFQPTVELFVASRFLKSASFFLTVVYVAFCPSRSFAQGEGSGLPANMPLSGGLIRSIAITDLDLYIKGPNGKPIEGTAVVTITKLDGQFYKQGTARDGYVRFNELAQSEYDVQVIAPGFVKLRKQIDAHPQGETLMKLTVQLEAAAEGIDATTDMEVAALNPKAQRALSKAIEALRAKKPSDARSSLETAARIAPQSAEVQYVYGVYALGTGDKAQAKTYWLKSLELYPQHFRALISLSEQLWKRTRLAKHCRTCRERCEPNPLPGGPTRSLRRPFCDRVRLRRASSRRSARWS